MNPRLMLRGAFPKSVDEYTQPVERLLQLRRAEMDAAWGTLEEEWAAHNERMVSVGLAPRTDEEGMVKLNVGGLNVNVSWRLLAVAEGFEDSVLGALLEGDWAQGRIPRDGDGRIVLDESPTCIKHIVVHTTLRANGRACSLLAGLPQRAASSAVAIDEAPCLVYAAHVMGLAGSMPAHLQYLKINGGCTTLEPFEIAPFTANIREWVGGSTDELTLIYRATRDGFGREEFRARCNKHSPETVSLIRVSSGQENDDDSVVGGRTCSPWVNASGSRQQILDHTFVFMLKDGSATRRDLWRPLKWNTNPEHLHDFFNVHRSDGPYFGAGDLATTFDKASGSCTIKTKHSPGHFRISKDSPFLALNGEKVVDIEVYRCSNSVSREATAPSTTKSRGDVLTDAEAHDIHSFGQSIASSLMEERVVLDRAAKEMETAGAKVSAAVGALETVYGPSVAAGEQDVVVELNVRGTRMTTLLSTLQACPRSVLARMFDAERWPATEKDKDEHGRRFIDCSPSCFSKILDVLRMRKRASWSRGTTPEKQEGISGKCPGAIFVKKTDLKAFRTAVQMYFPGCESFIMGLCSVCTTPAAW